MKNITLFLCLLAVPGFCSSVALGNQPSDNNEKIQAFNNPVTQQKLEDCDFTSKTARTFEGIKVNTDTGGDVFISGKDSSGKKLASQL